MKTCTVCKHPKRKTIERRIVGGTAGRDIAREFHLDRQAPGKHKRHMGSTLVKASAHREVNFGESLLSHLERLIADFERFANKAELLGEIPAAIVATREIRDTLKLAYELVEKFKPAAAPVAIEKMSADEKAELNKIFRRLGLDDETNEKELALLNAKFPPKRVN